MAHGKLQAPGSRRAFTLLEVLLATSIAVLLLAALYAAVNIQLQSAQTGRDVVEQSTLARSLLTRVGNDISGNLGPVDPAKKRPSQGGQQPQGGSTQPGGTNPSASQNTPTTPGANGSGTPSTSAPNSSSQNSSTPNPATGLNGPVTFNLGVQGDNERLTLYISRVPRELNFAASGQDPRENPIVVSDVRRITYWLVGGAGSPQGLAREEVTLVTSDEALESLPPNIPDEASHIIAEEVRSVEFSYFDGTDWLDGWDGTQTGPDGVTPIGPPRAIAIVLGVAPPGSANEGADSPNVKKYRHVVVISTANGPSQQAATTSSTTQPPPSGTQPPTTGTTPPAPGGTQPPPTGGTQQPGNNSRPTGKR